MKETIGKLKKLSNALQQVGALLKKDSVIWPYQQMDENNFLRKYFPNADSIKEIIKFKKLNPEKFLKAIENKLRSIDAILDPLEDRMKALEFQYRLLSYFAIYSPKKLKDCQKILNSTPRGIREGFTSDKNLDLAIRKGFNQKNVAEIMALWLNMRYYGALSCGLSPRILLISVKDPISLKKKLLGLEESLKSIRPKVENKHEEYSEWVLKKQKIDEERKMMTFGPESVQTLEKVLGSVYQLSLGGELTQKEAMELVNKAKTIIIDAIKVGGIEKKILISKEKREELEKIISDLSKKPRLFFIIAQISNLIENGEQLKEAHISALEKIENVIKLLPKTTEEVINNEDLKNNLQLIFEPLKLIQAETKIGKKKIKKQKKISKQKQKVAPKKEIEKRNNLEIIQQIFDEASKWFLNRVIEEKKEGLENLIEIFNGIPLGLGLYIARLVTRRIIKVNVEKFKECLIGYLGNTGVYELYSQLGKGYREDAEIEMVDEIIIPPQADQRLAAIQKQIKFEFMKFMETVKLKKTPLFNIFEIYKIPPIKFVDRLLEDSQYILVNIITFNAERKLYELLKLNPEEYEVKLITLNLKLSSFIKIISKTLEKIVSETVEKKKFQETEVLDKFGQAIKKIWIKSLIDVKKIEPKEEEEIITGKVSALAAKLDEKFKKVAPAGSQEAPPRVSQPSVSSQTAPYYESTRPISSLVIPPSASAKPAPPQAKLFSISTSPAPPRAAPPSALEPAPPRAAIPSAPPQAAPSSAPLKSGAPQAVPDFIKREKEPKISPNAKIIQLKETIEETMKLVECSMVDMDKLSPESLKNALQLVYQLRELEKTDVNAINPSKIRQITDLAESLKKSKETIILQKEKLRKLEMKLNERVLLAFDSKLELIAKLFDEFIQDLEMAISYLLGKGEKLIKYFGKKGGKDFLARQRIKKEVKILAKYVDILEKIGELSLEDFDSVRITYIAFQKAREEKKNKLIKKYSQQITELILIDRKEFLKLTRDPKLKTSLESLLKIN